MDRITIRVDERLKQQLENEAKLKGVRPSTIVREAIEEHIKRQSTEVSAFEIAERLGLVGVYKGTPTDLSTNPAPIPEPSPAWLVALGLVPLAVRRFLSRQ